MFDGPRLSTSVCSLSPIYRRASFQCLLLSHSPLQSHQFHRPRRPYVAGKHHFFLSATKLDSQLILCRT
ncbi:hypothetical protein HZ326_28685 [Fusarium oxysporum f. sp. albedinis]|nr:hypothetical protein HZ326_28685 [Fusarium oxysporum f. sp. albedinis]